MLFRYDFGKKLDLSRFKKQAPHYILNMREVTYDLFMPDYKMIVEIATPDNCTGHTGSLSLYDIIRDDDGDIVSEHVIVPLIDTRFREIQSIKDIFKIDHYKAHFDSNNATDTVEKICNLLKLIHKINNLKVFL
jgi:hypothetical protein